MVLCGTCYIEPAIAGQLHQISNQFQLIAQSLQIPCKFNKYSFGFLFNFVFNYLRNSHYIEHYIQEGNE